MQPFQPFLEALRAEGLGVGIDDHIAIQRVLALEGEWSADELRLALRATLARTEDEQQRFDRVASRWFVAPVAPAHLEAAAESQPDPSTRLWAWALTGLVLLMVVAGGLWWIDPFADPGPIEGPEPDGPVVEQVDPTEPVGDPIDPVLVAPEIDVTFDGPDGPTIEGIQTGPLSILVEPVPVPGRPWFLLGFALLGLLTTIASLSVVVRRRRRIQHTERVGPYTFRLGLQPGESRPLSLQEVDDLGAALTWSHDGQEVRRLDVSRTVAQTVRAAGRFEPVWQSAPPSPRYAVLLDLDRGPAPVSREIDGIFQQLGASGLQVERFHFRGEPEILVHTRTQERIRLDALASRGFHVLVVVGDPECAVDPDTGGPRSWVEWLQRVPDRGWLAAPHHARPGLGAAHLERAGMPVLPAQLEALSACRPDQPAELEPVPTWAPIVELEPGSRAAREELERVLGEGYAVLCAATVLPRFDGASLGWLLERLGGQVPAKSRLALLGLPWVGTGVPDALSDALQRDLADRFPALGAQVRSWVAEALEQAAPPEGSGAQLAWRLRRAELSTDADAKHAIYREIARDSALGESLVAERLRTLEPDDAPASGVPTTRALRDALDIARGVRWKRGALVSAAAAAVLLLTFLAAGRPPYEPVQAVYSGPESRFDLGVTSCDGRACDDGLRVHVDGRLLPAADDWEVRIRSHSIDRDVSRTGTWNPIELAPLAPVDGPRTTVVLPMLNRPVANDFESFSEESIAASVAVGDGSMEEIEDGDRVKETVRRYAGQMKYCYERQLNDNPELAGRVEIGWSLNAGVVEGASVVSNDTGDDRLSKCMVDRLRRWKFDADISGDVSWPFVFRAKRTGSGAARRALVAEAVASAWFSHSDSQVVIWPWGPGERTVFVDGPEQIEPSLFAPVDPEAPPLGRYAAVRAGLDTVDNLADRPLDVVIVSGGFDAESLTETCGDHIERAAALESQIRRVTTANPDIRVHTFGFGTPVGGAGSEGRRPGRASIDATEQRGWCGSGERPSFRELEAENAVPAADLRGFAAAGAGLSGFGTTEASLSAFLQAVAAPRTAGWVLPESALVPSTEVARTWDVTEVSLRSAALDVEVTACVSDSHACPRFDTGYADLAVLVAAVGDYPGTAMDLIGPSIDARAISEQLGARGIRVETLLDQGVTVDSVTARLAALSESVGPDGAVAFVWVGHAQDREGEPLLIPGDADPADPLAAPLTLDALLTAMEGPKHGLLLLDTGVGPVDGEPFAPRIMSTRYTSRQILSLESGEVGMDSKKGSPFIRAFLNALVGPGARSTSDIAAVMEGAQVLQVGRGGDFVFPVPRVDRPPDSALDDAVQKRIYAQETERPEDFLAAAEAYGAFLKRYPYASSVWHAQWNMALSLMRGGAPNRAIEVFEDLIRTGRTGAHPYVDSALVLRLDLRFEQLEAVGGPGELPPGATVERTLRRNGKTIQEYALGTQQRAVIEATDALLAHTFRAPPPHMPGVPDFTEYVEDNLPQYLFLPGQIEFWHNRFDTARPRLRRVVDEAPESEEATQAAKLLRDSYVEEGDLEGAQRIEAELGPLLNGNPLPALRVDLVELAGGGTVVGLSPGEVVQRGASLALEVTIPEQMYVAAYYLDEILVDGSQRLNAGRHRIAAPLPDHAGDERFWVVASREPGVFADFPAALPQGRVPGVVTVSNPGTFVGSHRRRALQVDAPTIVDSAVQSAAVPEFRVEVVGAVPTLEGPIRPGQVVPPGAPMRLQIHSDQDAVYAVFLDGEAVENGEATVAAGATGTVTVTPPVLPGPIRVVVVGSDPDRRVTQFPGDLEDPVGRTRTQRDSLVPFHTPSMSVVAFEVDRSIQAMLPGDEQPSAGDVTLPDGFQAQAPERGEPQVIEETETSGNLKTRKRLDDQGRVIERTVTDLSTNEVVETTTYTWSDGVLTEAETSSSILKLQYDGTGRLVAVGEMVKGLPNSQGPRSTAFEYGSAGDLVGVEVAGFGGVAFDSDGSMRGEPEIAARAGELLDPLWRGGSRESADLAFALQQRIEDYMSRPPDPASDDVISLPKTSDLLPMIRRQARDLQPCFQRGLSEDPNLGGKVVLRFQVKRGDVVGVRVRSNDTGNTAFGTCLKKAAESWSFSSDSTLAFTYPFVFQNPNTQPDLGDDPLNGR